MSDVDTKVALKLWVVLSRAFAAVSRHALADIHRHGLSEGEFAVMDVLYHKGPLLLGEVQRKILASSGGVTYLVDRLEAEGLVERLECPSDRRSRYAALTRKGSHLMKRIFPVHTAAIERALSGLTTAEKRRAIDLLRTLGTTAAAAATGAAPTGAAPTDAPTHRAAPTGAAATKRGAR